MSCLLCKLNLDDFKTTNVRLKGLKTLIQCSIDRNDNLVDTLRGLETITLHVECRRRYTRRHYPSGKLSIFLPPDQEYDRSEVKFQYIPIINKNSSSSIAKKPGAARNVAKNPSAKDNDTTSTENECNHPVKWESTSETSVYLTETTLEAANNTETKYNTTIKLYPEQETDNKSQLLTDDDDPTKPFPFQHNCFICGKVITDDSKIPLDRRKPVYRVARECTQETMMCHLRKNPTPDSIKILQRIQNVNLLKENARYHKYCYNQTQPKSEKKGRPKEGLITSAVDKICRYIDGCDRNEFTSSELMSTDLIGDDYQPHWRTIKSKLEKIYEGKIYFTSSIGRSTVVTVTKDTGPSGSAVIQPWNLNGTELGGILEDVNVRRKKRKYVKQKKKELMAADGTINKNKCDEEKVPEIKENYDDFINDTFDYPEENDTKDESNVLICLICLSSDRRLEDIGNHRDVLQKICSDIFTESFEPKLFLICWECIALLKNVKQFQKKIMTAQKLWNTEVKEPPKSLSTLSITTPSSASVSYTNKNIETVHETKSQEYVKPEEVTVEFLPQDLDVPTKDENVKEDENNMDNDTFDYDTKDMNIDDDSEDQEELPLSRRRKAKVKNKKCEESDQDSDDSNFKNKQSAEDPDWEEVEGKSRREQKKKVKVAVKIPYTIIVQTYITATKMKREPIEPQELQYWLDAERNSDYFQSLKHNKCFKCISEVPDNHDKLCHSEEHPYVCKICECTFASKEEQDTHETNHYFIFSCEFCRYKCYNETHMSHHVESHRRLIQCLECFAAFESFDGLEEHFNTLHRYAECDHCGKQFPHKRMIKTHIDRFHTPHICTICNTQYSNYAHKIKHMKLKHRVERTEAAYCVQCDIQFDNPELLKRHVYHSVKHRHEWKRQPPKKVKEQHKCPECDNVYASKHTFRCHYNLVHAKKIKFYCNYCDKPFPSKANYKVHMRRHEGYKLPKDKFCHICGRGFSSNVILTNHIRTHTGERPFACPHCPSSFAQKAALRSHIAHIHEKRQRTTAPSTKQHEQPDFLNYTF